MLHSACKHLVCAKNKGNSTPLQYKEKREMIFKKRKEKGYIWKEKRKCTFEKRVIFLAYPQHPQRSRLCDYHLTVPSKSASGSSYTIGDISSCTTYHITHMAFFKTFALFKCFTATKSLLQILTSFTPRIILLKHLGRFCSRIYSIIKIFYVLFLICSLAILFWRLVLSMLW